MNRAHSPQPARARRPSFEVAPGPSVAALAAAHPAIPGLARALELEALLHLPRLADASGFVAHADAQVEVARLHRRLLEWTSPVAELLRPPPVEASLDDARVDEVDERVAATVCRRLHYLHSPRADSFHLGSYTRDDRLAALVSLSPLDVAPLASALPPGLEPEEVLVVSRVFAFEWAPRNTISHLLARAERRLRVSRPEIRLLFTYLNPNLGFRGASYRAANWVVFGRETGTRYGYLDDDYVTDRAIDRLPRGERRRVVYSTMQLSPLVLYARLLHRRDRRLRLVETLVPRPSGPVVGDRLRS